MTIAILWLAACEPVTGPAGGDGTSSSPETPPVAAPEPERLCQVDVTCGGNILDEPKVPCAMHVTDADGGVLYDGSAGIELRGRSSLTFPKPQYSVELRDYSELPVWPGANWRYLPGGVDPGPSWRDVAFDDSSWPTGPAPIGWGEPWIATPLAPGAVTTWFRYSFAPNSLPSIADVDLGIRHGDGVAVYLNGQEILRDGLPPDATADTLATQALPEEEKSEWISLSVDPALLVDGTNVLAVELHQADPNGVSAVFDAWLDGAGEDHPTDFFDMGKDSDWILDGLYVDRVLFRNRLAFDLFQSLGGTDRYAPQSRFCELTLGGEYEGVYRLGEKIEKESDRVDIGSGDVAGDSFIVQIDDADGFRPNEVGAGSWQLVYPDDDADSEAVVSAFLTGWESAILGPDAADPTIGIFGYLDLDSAVDFVLLEELMKNADAYQWSVYLWKDAGGLMHFAPWDFDLSLGYPGPACSAEGWNARNYQAADGTIQPIEYIQAMAAVPAFHDRLVSRWAELRQDQLSDEAIGAWIAAYDATLSPAIQANFDRWPIGEISFTPDGTGNWLCPASSYDDEHQHVLDFLAARLAWMDANIATF